MASPISAGVTNPENSSGSANRALSRASASVAATISGSSEPAEATPCRPSTTTRIVIPSLSATVSDSTAPRSTSTSVSRPRPTRASICSAPRADPATSRAITNRSRFLVMLRSRRLLTRRREVWAAQMRPELPDHPCHRYLPKYQSRSPRGQSLVVPEPHCQSTERFEAEQ